LLVWIILAIAWLKNNFDRLWLGDVKNLAFILKTKEKA
jgi:hypothetical protein